MPKKRLLIVEDDESVLYCLTLVTECWEVTVAKTYNEAMDCLKDEREKGGFDLIVTDFNFPGGNGMQISEHARFLGNQVIYLHSSDIMALKDNTQLYDIKFEKLDRGLLKLLKEMGK